MKGLVIVLSIVLFAICLVLAAVILLQQGKSAGLSSAISGGNSDSYFGKNKGRTLEGKLNKATKILAACYMVVCLLLYFAFIFIS